MKRIIVFGGSGTIGKAVCVLLKSSGYYVVSADLVDMPEIQYRDEFIECDIALPQNIEAAIGKDPYAIVNCTYPKTKTYGTKWQSLDSSEFTRFLTKNVIFAFDIVRQGLKAGCKNFVLLSSIYGSKPPEFWIYAGTTVYQTPIEYAVAKAGLNQMIRYLAKDLMRIDVRINGVAPGGIESLNMDAKFKENYETIAPFTNVNNVAKAVLSLIENDSMTGQIMTVDGGFSL